MSRDLLMLSCWDHTRLHSCTQHTRSHTYCTYTHTHTTHTHTHTHTYTHTRTHTHTHTHIHNASMTLVGVKAERRERWEDDITPLSESALKLDPPAHTNRPHHMRTSNP